MTKPKLSIDKQTTANNVSKVFLKIFNLGQKRLISSIMWVQTLLESDHSHYKGDELKNWLFIRFDQITDLDTKFLEAYKFGTLYLSVIKNDRVGASHLYRKALSYYPDHFELNLNAGFHFYFEENDPKSALKYLKTVQESPQAPPYLPSLIAKILREDKAPLQEIFQYMVSKLIITPKTNPIHEKFYNNAYAIKAEIDLNCLNSKARKNCSLADFDGKNYIFKDGKYVAQKKWKKFNIYKRKEETSSSSIE